MSAGARFGVFIATLVILHFLLRLTFGVGSTAPDFLTVALLLGARRTRPAFGASLGFLLGLLRDALSVTAFGSAIITLTLLGYLGSRIRDLFEGESLIFILLYLFIGKWLHDVLYGLVSLGPILDDAVGVMFLDQPLAALLAAAAGTIALAVFRLTDRR